MDPAHKSLLLRSDDAFDSLYAMTWREHSSKHWTPVHVGAIAARWLTEDPGVDRVLDVGSGVGKLCIVGALATGRTFVGVEQRPALIAAAEAAVLAAGVSSHVRFLCARASLPLLSEFRAIYLYNPFAEHTSSPTSRIDDSVELSFKRYKEDVALVEEVLRRAPVGQRVVTLHGFGGEMPQGYVEEHCEPVGNDLLQLWVKHLAL